MNERDRGNLRTSTDLLEWNLVKKEPGEKPYICGLLEKYPTFFLFAKACWISMKRDYTR